MTMMMTMSDAIAHACQTRYEFMRGKGYSLSKIDIFIGRFASHTLV